MAKKTIKNDVKEVKKVDVSQPKASDKSIKPQVKVENKKPAVRAASKPVEKKTVTKPVAKPADTKKALPNAKNQTVKFL